MKCSLLCDAPEDRGGTWSRDGVILFSSLITKTIEKVSAAGGLPVPATALGDGESSHRRPYFLPDGRNFVYYANTTVAATSDLAIYLASLDSPERKLLLKADSQNVFYSQGYLLFLRESTLM